MGQDLTFLIHGAFECCRFVINPAVNQWKIYLSSKNNLWQADTGAQGTGRLVCKCKCVFPVMAFCVSTSVVCGFEGCKWMCLCRSQRAEREGREWARENGSTEKFRDGFAIVWMYVALFCVFERLPKILYAGNSFKNGLHTLSVLF